MTGERIRIRREDLFADQVDREIARGRQLRGRPVPPAAPVSPLRETLSNPLVHLPVAGILATLLAWLLLEPGFHDTSRVAGEVLLVNADPVEFSELEVDGVSVDAISFTVGTREIVAIAREVLLEPGVRGQPPLRALAAIEAGTVIDAAGEALDGNRLLALAIRPATAQDAARVETRIEPQGSAVQVLFFPVTALLIAVALLVAEGITTRNWVRMTERVAIGALLTLVFSFLAYVPAGVLVLASDAILGAHEGVVTVATITGPSFVLFTALRSAAWACIGAGLGLGMNLARSTKVQLRNSVIGGTLGGALGGLFFDPIDRFLGMGTSLFKEASLSRLVGLLAVGACVGLFVALVERLAREAWVRVRTGPLAGKSFVLYRTPTRLGSSPRAEIYLFKDAEIEADHAVIHRIGNRYEIEDQGTRGGTRVAGRRVRRQRLASGDQIVLGATVLEFDERAKQGAAQ